MSISQSEQKRAIFRSRRKYQTDLQSNLATAEDRGKKIGVKQRSVEIAQNLMNMGFSINQIVTATGLSTEEVEQLKLEN